MLIMTYPKDNYSHSSPYATYLSLALQSMTLGEQEKALIPLKQALQIDRNDICGLLTLGTLYLQTGSFRRAKTVFAQVRRLSARDPFARWGEALVLLEEGNIPQAATQFQAFSQEKSHFASQSALVLHQYCRVLQGESVNVARECSDVSEAEPNPLRLFVAGWAMLNGGNPRVASLYYALF